MDKLTIAVAGLVLVMLAGVVGAFWSKIRRNAPFGLLFVRSVALLAAVPGLMILALLGVLDAAVIGALIWEA